MILAIAELKSSKPVPLLLEKKEKRKV